MLLANWEFRGIPALVGKWLAAPKNRVREQPQFLASPSIEAVGASPPFWFSANCLAVMGGSLNSSRLGPSISWYSLANASQEGFAFSYNAERCLSPNETQAVNVFLRGVEVGGGAVFR